MIKSVLIFRGFLHDIPKNLRGKKIDHSSAGF